MKDKNQKRNLKTFEKGCRIVDALSEKHKANYYLIQEYENISVFSQDQYDCVKDDYSCKKCDWIGDNRKNGRCPNCNCKVETFIGSEFFKLVYSKKYKKPVNSFEDAKEAADLAAKEIGGTWHVIAIEIKRKFRSDKIQYIEVSKHYFKTHPKAKSLYEVGDSEISLEYLKGLGLNRQQRRKFLRK